MVKIIRDHGKDPCWNRFQKVAVSVEFSPYILNTEEMNDRGMNRWTVEIDVKSFYNLVLKKLYAIIYL